MLTPADIEQKTFSTALRGYDLDEVDDFLDQVVATIRDLQEELAEARSTAAKSPEPVADESAVGRALIAAQSAADQIMAAAREEADRLGAEAGEEAERLMVEAREQADRFIAERDSKKAEAEAEMQMLSERVSNIRTQLALLATAVADKLDEMDALISSQSTGSEDVAESQSWDEEEVAIMASDDDLLEGGDAEQGGSLFDDAGSDGEPRDEEDDDDEGLDEEEGNEEEADDLP